MSVPNALTVRLLVCVQRAFVISVRAVISENGYIAAMIRSRFYIGYQITVSFR